MAELSPEQIAKGYFTDISGVGTALEKAQEQQLLREKLAKEKQDKLYQGIKDISGVFDNKFAATGTSADPILLAQIGKIKNGLTEGIMNGTISPSAAYMAASGKVADINNLAGTISQYRQNTEKKITELKKDHPELNSEQLLNDAIKSAIYNPETGEIVAPNSNYDYASTLFNQDRLGRYTDRELLNANNQKVWKDLEGTQGYMKTGPFTYEHKLKPGQIIVPGRNGGMGIDFESLQVGQENKENIVNKNGKAVKQIVKVGGFPGASDALLYHFEGNRGLKSAAQYELAGLDEVAKNDPEFAKKWNELTPEDKYRVAALKYAKSNLGTGGSYIKPADLSAEAQYNLKIRELAQKNEKKNYVNPVEALIRDFRSGETNPNRLLSHFKDQGILMGYAQDAYDEEGKPLKIYGKPEIKGNKLMIVPYSSYRALDKNGKPVKDLKFSDGTPITQGRGYDLLNRDKSISEQEANTMLNVYGRINDDQPDIYTK